MAEKNLREAVKKNAKTAKKPQKPPKNA